MSNQVKVTYVGIPHYVAYCTACNWCYEDARDRQKGRREIYKHVKQTGHTVHVESSAHTHYGPAD